jgi:hypothetical protein
MRYVDPFGLASTDLRNNINRGPINMIPTGSNVPVAIGDLFGQLNDWGNAYLGMKALEKLDCAIRAEQSTIPYGMSKQYDVFYGTAPTRFVGLSETGTSSVINSDVKSYPITIDGLGGLSGINLTDYMVKDEWNRNPNNQCNKCHRY